MTHSARRRDDANTTIGRTDCAVLGLFLSAALSQHVVQDVWSALRLACAPSIAAPTDPCRAGPPMALAASGHATSTIRQHQPNHAGRPLH